MFFYDPRPKDQQTVTLTSEPNRHHRQFAFSLSEGWRYNAGFMWGEEVQKDWQVCLDEKFQRDWEAVA